MVISTDEMVALALETSGLADLPTDSEIIVPGEGITRIAVAIDLDLPELMLARHVGCDGALTHHPRGRRSRLKSADILWRHATLMENAGVPATTANRLAGDLVRRSEVERHRTNYDKWAAAAEVIGLPFVGLHTPLDEIGRRRMQERADEVLAANPEATVGEVVDGLSRFATFRNAETDIEVRHGSAGSPAGRTVVCHGAGCNGGFAIAKAYFDAGVDTLIYIHVNAAELARIRAETTGTLLVTGHIASDSLGINPFLDALRERGVESTNLGGIVSGGV